MKIALSPTPLKVDVLEEIGGTLLTAIAGTEERVINGDPKYVVTLGDDEYTLILNETNKRVLVKAFGAESDDWNGRQVEAFVGTSHFNGESKPSTCLRIPPVPEEKTIAAADLLEPASGDGIKDDIPF